MERKVVVSSNLASIGYDSETLTLEVEFHQGAVWQYTPVTQSGYNQLMMAESVGSFFARNIKAAPGIQAMEIS